MVKRVIAVILVVLMLFSTAACSTTQTNNKSGKKTFKWADGPDEYMPEDVDEYTIVNQNGNEFSTKVAKVSIRMELTALAADTEDWSNATENIDYFFNNSFGKDHTFEDIEHNPDSFIEPTRETMGVSCATMKNVINDEGEAYNLVAVVARGAKYRAEWAANSKVGKDGYSEGFDKPAKNLKKFLYEYLDKHKISGKTKLWIVGLSRGGAVASLLAKYCDDELETLSGDSREIKQEDLLAYTFGTPLAATYDTVKNEDGSSKKLYMNIHNVIDPNDIVSKIVPPSWNMARPGVDVWFDYRSEEGYKTEKECYEKAISKLNVKDEIKNYFNDIESFEMYKISDDIVNDSKKASDKPLIVKDTTVSMRPGEFFDKVIDMLGDQCIGDRDKYVKTYEEALCNLLYIIKKEESNISDIVDAISDQILDITVLLPLVASIINDDTESMVDTIKGVIISGIGEVVPDLDETSIDSTLDDLVLLLLNAFVHSPNDMITLIKNTKVLGAAHQPRIMLAMADAMDLYVDEMEEEITETDGGYRSIKIYAVPNGTEKDKYVEVAEVINTLTVYNTDLSEKIPVFELENGKVKTNDERSSYSFSNGSLLINLPVNHDYNFTIDSEKGYLLNALALEYSKDTAKYTRYINQNIVTSGKVNTFIIGASSSNHIALGSDSVYTLAGGKKVFDKKNVELLDVAIEAKGVSSDEKLGFAVASPSVTVPGNVVEFTALYFSPTKFVGWYDGNTLVSKEPCAFITLHNDIELTAKFTK